MEESLFSGYQLKWRNLLRKRYRMLWRGRKVDHLSTRLEEDSSAPSPQRSRGLEDGFQSAHVGVYHDLQYVNYFGGC